MSVICDKVNKPVMTAAQIAECQKCKHASEKKVWCCLFGIWIQESGKNTTITTAAKTVNLYQRKKLIPKPTLPQMAEHFGRAMVKWAGSGFKTVAKETYIVRRQICSDCIDGRTCPHCGCQLWAKVALATEKCPEGK
jgi:hypothetical protein